MGPTPKTSSHSLITVLQDCVTSYITRDSVTFSHLGTYLHKRPRLRSQVRAYLESQHAYACMKVLWVSVLVLGTRTSGGRASPFACKGLCERMLCALVLLCMSMHMQHYAPHMHDRATMHVQHAPHMHAYGKQCACTSYMHNSTKISNNLSRSQVKCMRVSS